MTAPPNCRHATAHRYAEHEGPICTRCNQPTNEYAMGWRVALRDNTNTILADKKDRPYFGRIIGQGVELEPGIIMTSGIIKPTIYRGASIYVQVLLPNDGRIWLPFTSVERI